MIGTNSALSILTPPQYSNSTDGQTIRNAIGGFKCIAGYEVTELLGKGTFATVYKGVKQSTEIFAIKAIDVNDLIFRFDRNLKDLFNREISILQKSKGHPNIVCLHRSYEISDHIFLFLEYCAGGDLKYLIRSRESGRLTERLARRLMRDLTAGLKFLASHKLIHRDIKPQNLMLTGPLPLDEIDDPARITEVEEARTNADFPSHLFKLKIAGKIHGISFTIILLIVSIPK